METTVEGVEVLDEVKLIRELGCSHIQGYIYGRPAVANEVTRQLLTQALKPTRPAIASVARRALQCSAQRWSRSDRFGIWSAFATSHRKAQ
jgi:predicted signal transduction protein with EAL and GGDEF domain